MTTITNETVNKLVHDRIARNPKSYIREVVCKTHPDGTTTLTCTYDGNYLDDSPFSSGVDHQMERDAKELGFLPVTKSELGAEKGMTGAVLTLQVAAPAPEVASLLYAKKLEDIATEKQYVQTILQGLDADAKKVRAEASVLGIDLPEPSVDAGAAPQKKDRGR